jgi:hypothetical protein
MSSVKNFPISSNNFNCGVKIKAGALFKNMQQHDASGYHFGRKTTIRLRIRGLLI